MVKSWSIQGSEGEGDFKKYLKMRLNGNRGELRVDVSGGPGDCELELHLSI